MTAFKIYGTFGKSNSIAALIEPEGEAFVTFVVPRFVFWLTPNPRLSIFYFSCSAEHSGEVPVQSSDEQPPCGDSATCPE